MPQSSLNNVTVCAGMRPARSSLSSVSIDAPPQLVGGATALGLVAVILHTTTRSTARFFFRFTRHGDEGNGENCLAAYGSVVLLFDDQ